MGLPPPHSNYLGVFLRFIRSFAEVIKFGEASAAAPKYTFFSIAWWSWLNFDFWGQISLRNWDDSTPFVATCLAIDFEVVGTDAAHKLKLLAL